jgi:histone arginine demethylase JMJD6
VEIDGKNYLMPEFIDLVFNSSDQNPAPCSAARSYTCFFHSSWPRSSPVPPFLPNWLDGPMAKVFEKPALFVDGRGGKFPYMHFDGAHSQAFICQLYGTKKFYTYPPDQTPYLYIRYNVSTIPDVERPDFKKFSLLAKATQTSFTLEPGEILCMPPGLWHTTKMVSPSISIAMNRANAANWSSSTHDAVVRVPWYPKPPLPPTCLPWANSAEFSAGNYHSQSAIS